MKITLLAIDPSIRSIGWATFNGDPHNIANSLNHKEWHYGVFNPDRERLYDSIKDNFITNFPRIDRLIIEVPTFQNSEKGRIAAKEGYTTQLGIIVGYLMGLIAIPQAQMYLYPPIVWKGNVPKEITLAKLKREFNNSDWILDSLKDDTVDAIGMLKYYLTTQWGWT